jgi:hypothetical protein
LAVNWSAQVSVRALSGLSLEYFGAISEGNTACVVMAPHYSSRNSFHLRPFSLPEISAVRYFSPHPVADGAGFTTTAVDVGGEDIAVGGDGSCTLESGAGVVADAAGSAAWASRPMPAELLAAITPRLFSIAEAIWKNTTSPIEAVIFQPIFFIASSRN